jgi:hypothetical protein
MTSSSTALAPITASSSTFTLTPDNKKPKATWHYSVGGNVRVRPPKKNKKKPRFLFPGLSGTSSSVSIFTRPDLVRTGDEYVGMQKASDLGALYVFITILTMVHLISFKFFFFFFSYQSSWQVIAIFIRILISFEIKHLSRNVPLKNCSVCYVFSKL